MPEQFYEMNLDDYQRLREEILDFALRTIKRLSLVIPEDKLKICETEDYTLSELLEYAESKEEYELCSIIHKMISRNEQR